MNVALTRDRMLIGAGLASALLLGVTVATPKYWGIASGLAALVLFLLLAVARPRWAMLGIVAFPPGLFALISSSAGLTLYIMLAVIGAAVLAFFIGPRRIGNVGLAVGYAIMLAAMTWSYARNQVPNAIGSVNSLTTFFYYGAVYLLAINTSPEDAGERMKYAESLQIAVLISILITGAIALFQLPPGFFSSFNIGLFPEDAGLLYTRTHFGYLMAMGFAVALPRLTRSGGLRGVWIVLTAVTAGLVVVSLTRGAWISALLFVAISGVLARRWILALSLPVSWLLSLVPSIQNRLVGDLSGGALLAMQSGAAGSHRMLLWAVLVGVAARSWIFGHGFGYVSSLAPSLYFGEGQFVTQQNALVYAHNDILYLVLELGLLGAIPFILALGSLWTSLIRGLRGTWPKLDSQKAAIALTCLGVAIVALFSQMADNGFFIRAVFERFAVIAATLWLIQDAKHGILAEDRAGERPLRLANDLETQGSDVS